MLKKKYKHSCKEMENQIQNFILMNGCVNSCQ
jgi:hypothetical protein